MADSLTLRRYRPVDRDRALDLHERAMREVGAYVEGVPDPDLDDIESAYLEPGGEFLVGETDSEVVAMGAFRPAEGYVTELLDDLENAAEIKRMRVAPAWQGRGYGRQVYGELERRARESGFDELVLDTTPAQTAAQALYESAGFNLARRERLEHDGGSVALLFYRKFLDGE